MPILEIISHNFPASLERKVPGKGGHLQIVANSYVAKDIDAKNDSKISLVFAHATGFHKELWNPIIKILHERRDQWNGGDMWTFDFSNHGDSAVLNQDVLPDTVMKFDAAQDILQLIDKAKIKKPIIGIGHSIGGHSMLLAEIIRPGTFTSILAIEPIINPSYIKEIDPLQELKIKRRRDIWPNREAAYTSFIMKEFFQNWDPEVLNLHIQYGLRELPSGEVTLKCPKIQELYSFFSDKLSKITLFHRISEIQCPVLFIVGEKSNFDFKDLSLLKASQCKHSELISIDAGHLVPMEKPIQVAYIIEYFARKSINSNQLQKNGNICPVSSML